MIQDIQPAKLDNQYNANAIPAGGDYVFVIDGMFVACRRIADVERGGWTIELPRVDELAKIMHDRRIDTSLRYLFALDDHVFWYLDACEVGELVAYPLLFFFELRRTCCVSKELVFACSTAIHLGAWYRSNRFCGACGHALSHGQLLRSLQCTSCGNQVFPRINPAVIVAVCDPLTSRIVLTRYANQLRGIDALVAGFVEIGETLEQCVEREVMEELGLKVHNIRYYKSQPWGIAGDILSGFWADVCGDTTIHRDVSELGSAYWATPQEVTGQPVDYSLTNEMMCVWRDAELRKTDRFLNEKELSPLHCHVAHDHEREADSDNGTSL